MSGCRWRPHFAREGALRSSAFDIDASRVRELGERAGSHARSRSGRILQASLPLKFTSDAGSDLRNSLKLYFFIVTVPTPIDETRRPDLRAIFEASKLVGGVLKKGDIVVYESTVYPGAIEEEVRTDPGTVLGLKVGFTDFNVGYSPERINPGDKQHRLESITKVVSAQNSGDARHRCRRLRVGGEGRHSSRAFDQGRRSGQGDRKHPARSQHRLHERIVVDLSSTRD